LVRPHACLADQDAVHQRRLLQDGVRVAADDHIDSPGGIEHRGQLAVRVKAYMRQQHGEIDIIVLVGLDDLADFAPRLLQ